MNCVKCGGYIAQFDEAVSVGNGQYEHEDAGVCIANLQVKLGEQTERLDRENSRLKAALNDVCSKALRYDAAIQAHAGSSAVQKQWAAEGYRNPFLYGGDDLEQLYIEWLQAARWYYTKGV